MVRLLAEGGMGAVYVVEQLSSGAQRALKVLHPDLVRDARTREQFMLEARIGAQIDSGHVVDVIAAGVDEDTNLPWMAMELLEGEDLTDLIQRRGRLPLHEVGEIFDQLGDALAAAHSAGVIHRDLKPRNIFVARSRLRGMPFVVKVLDFGISKLLERSSVAVTVTRQIGSPLFMAPEQARAGAHLRRSTDVWPLGLLAYYLITGRHYWRSVEPEGVNLNALLMEITMAPIVAPGHRAEEQGLSGLLPDGFDSWFLQCVHRDPERRFADARVCTDVLRETLQGRHAAMLETEETVVRSLPDEPVSTSLPSGRGSTETHSIGVSQPSRAVVRRPSLAPPSFAPRRTEPGAGESRTSLRQLEPTLHTANTEVPVLHDQHDQQGDRHRRSVVPFLVASGGVLCLVGAVIFTVSSRPRAHQQSLRHTVSSRSMVSARVELHFQGFPRDARCSINGVSFGCERTDLQRASVPVVVHLEAPGRVPMDFSVLPDRDQNVVVPRMLSEPTLDAGATDVTDVTEITDRPDEAVITDTVSLAAANGSSETLSEQSTEPSRRARTAHTGRVSIGAEPPRCEVFIDGRSVGTTPIFSRSLRVGTHRLACVRDGHRLERTVNVRFGHNTDVVFPLR